MYTYLYSTLHTYIRTESENPGIPCFVFHVLVFNSVIFVLCICVIVAMEQVGVRLLATHMQEIHPVEIPMKTTTLLQSTTITDHTPLHTHMKTWYGSQM